MEHNRKQNLLMIIALVLSIASLSIGFAAFSVSLNISSQASVSPSSDTFSVKFSTNKDSLVVEPVTPSDNQYSLTATNGTIDNSTNPTIKGLSATFTQPGQYVEYTFYARNEGEYTAYLNNVFFDGKKKCKVDGDGDPTLVESACSSINLLVYVNEEEYSDTTPISGHSLAKGTGEEVKVRISYDIDGQVIAEPFSITFNNIVMIYSTIDDPTYLPPDNTLGKTLLMDIVKEGAISDSSIDFKSSAGLDVENNITYVMNSTINDSNPIYYYRGNVTKNNIKFANFCWKIVRTTETGGVKLIYNGVPGTDGSCNNTGTSTSIGQKQFYGSYSSPANVGYMFGVEYSVIQEDLSSQTELYIYGNDVEWDGTNYTLIDTTTSSSWKNDYQTLAKKYHYTCFNNTGICSEVYYIGSFVTNSFPYRLAFNNGKVLEGVIDEMYTNTKDSKIKAEIDGWYKTNMISFTDWLEDTVWCSDRTCASGALCSKDKSVSNSFVIFTAFYRNEPSVTCLNTRDCFTVDSANGNGNLTYPVGLLTADEYTLAGSGQKGYSASSYLNIGKSQWSMTPSHYQSQSAFVFTLNSSGKLNFNHAVNTASIRPSVSLKPGTYVSSGDGSVSNPYIVELI